jgi:hypothetical protein
MGWEGIAAEIVLALGSCFHLLHFLGHLSQGCQDAKDSQNITFIQEDFHISKSRAIFFIQQYRSSPADAPCHTRWKIDRPK